jgi:hypothetical protein
MLATQLMDFLHLAVPLVMTYGLFRTIE